MESSETRRSKTWATLREVGAAGGVMLGLLFVGVEIRENTTAIQGATLQAISDQSMNLQMDIATDPDLVRLMPRVITGGLLPDDLGEEDQYRVLVAYLSIIRVAENRFQQAALGTVPGADPNQFGTGSILYQTPYLRALWPRIRSNFALDFLEYFEREHGLG